MTRTDINEAQEEHLGGRRPHHGRIRRRCPRYTAAEAGTTTTFTSEAGITSYDASKPLTAYYPLPRPPKAWSAGGPGARSRSRVRKDQHGLRAAGRHAARKQPSSTERCTSCSSNIFSVVELRIDAGEWSPAGLSAWNLPRSEGFEGWLTFTGTVDPETLALTPAPDGPARN